MRMQDDCRYWLVQAGIAMPDADALRRIAMTLHRWHELECGDGNNHGSWCVTRGHKKNGTFEYDDNGKPFMEYHSHSANGPRYSAIPDRERGALKRLAKIMAHYSDRFTYYIQGDPRGAPLYIIPRDRVRADETVCAEWLSANYSRGLAVHK